MISEKSVKWYCKDFTKIENYDKAIADTEKVWICHHRLEKDYTYRELVSMGLYYHRPPEELIFVENKEMHQKLPHKGYKNQAKKILCVETATIYDTIGEAEKQTNIKKPNISKVLSGKRKTAGCFHWRYV